MKVAAAVIAGGYGTIDGECKLLAQLNGRPLIYRVIESLRAVRSLERIYVVINEKFGEQIRQALRDFDGLHYVVQPHRLGTAGAVRLVLEVLPEEFTHVLVTYGDMGAWQSKTHHRVIERAAQPDQPDLTLTVVRPPKGSKIERYGRVLKKDGKIFKTLDVWEIELYRNNQEIMDLLNQAEETNPSLYGFKVNFLRHALTRLKPVNKGDGHPNELMLQHTVEVAAQDGRHIAEVLVEDHREALGVNNKEELVEVRALFESSPRMSVMGNQPSLQYAA